MSQPESPQPDADERLKPTFGFFAFFALLELMFCLLFDSGKGHATAVGFIVSRWVTSLIITAIYALYLRMATSQPIAKVLPRAIVMGLGMVAGDIAYAFMSFR